MKTEWDYQHLHLVGSEAIISIINMASTVVLCYLMV